MAEAGKYKYRPGEFKEDSTKGSSRVIPKTYKGDVFVQVWLDSRKLATLSNWLDSNSAFTKFMSDVVRESLNILVRHLVEVEAAHLIDDTSYARDMLRTKYRVNLNQGNRGLKNAFHNIKLTEDRRNISGSIKIGIDDMRGRPVKEADLDEVKRATEDAMKVYREMEVKGFPSEKHEYEQGDDPEEDLKRIEQEDADLREMDMSSSAVFGKGDHDDD